MGDCDALGEEVTRPILKHLSKIGHRREAFLRLYLWLKDLGRNLVIIETGSARKANSYISDGQSTLFWDLLIEETGGICLSIDLETEFVESRNLQNVAIVRGDSIMQLRMRQETIRRCDLLYLDSKDFEYGSDASSIHHLAELTAAWEFLPLGSLIAVDDCHSEEDGKHVEVERFLAERGIQVCFDSYVKIWCKL